MKATPLKKQKSIFDYIITVGSRGANRLITLVVAILIARMLGAEAFGLYSLFFGIYILIFQAHAGTNIAYVRFSKKENPAEKSEIIKISVYIQLAILLFLCISGLPLSEYIAGLIELEDSNIIYYAFVAGGFIGLYGIWFGILQSEGKFGELGILNLLQNTLIIVIIAVIWFSSSDLTLDDVLMLYIGSSALFGFLSIILLLKGCASLAIDLDLGKAFSKMVFVNMLITSSYFLYRYIDVYFIQYYSDLETVGIYSAAMKTSMLLNILAGSLPTILLPKAVQAAKSGALIKTYFIKSYLISLAICFLFMIFYYISPWFLELLFGAEYLSASDMLKWLILGWVVNVLYIPISQLFYAYDMAKQRLAVEILKVIFAVAGFIYLIPKYGAIGAAYSLFIAIVLALGLAIIILMSRIQKSLKAR